VTTTDVPAADSHGKAVALVEEARELLGRNTADAESRARSSLRAAAETYWYAELSDRAEPEHEYLHEIGQWTRETFGCEITVQGDEYSTSCPVKLADKRLGMSIGFVARKWCSICDEDLSECSHRADRLYWVAGGATAFGSCRVCGVADCAHGADQLFPAPVIAVIKSFDRVEEASLVDVPAQPLARFASLPINTSTLRAGLGAAFTPGVRVSCDHCLSPYHGLPEAVNVHPVEDPDL
jgi:hypothetical protein